MRLKLPLFLMAIALALSSSLFGGLAEEIQVANTITVEQLGQLMSVSQVGSLVSFLALPLIERAMGPHAMLVLGIIGSGAALLGMGLSRSVVLFALFFLLNSVMGYIYITSNTVMLVASDPKRVRYSIPLMHLVYSVGAIASGWYVTYLKNGVWYHGYLHTAALFVIFGVYLAFQPTPPSIERYSKRPQRLVDSFSLLKNRKFLAYLLFLILANAIEFTNVVYPFIALTQIHHGGAKEIGLGISILHGGATASRLLVLPLLKKSNRAKTILLILAFISIAALLLFGMAPSLTIAYIAMALLGVGMGGVNPISQVLEISVWPEEIMQLSNIRAMGSTVGRIIIPLIISLITASAGLAPIFTFLAVVMGLGTVALLVFRP